MKILLFGKDGQLGKAFRTLLESSPIVLSGCQVEYLGRNECDLSDALSIESILLTSAPDLVINAAAYTAVDKAERESNLAFLINATAPGIMAKYAAAHGATLLHYSTDYVFDGSGADFYCETDPVNPLGVYGKSKAAGEVEIQKAFLDALSPKGRYAIIRTSWVYGDGGNFIRTILRLAQERESLKVIHDQYGVPTSAQWLADIGLQLGLNEKGFLRNFPSGIYHAVPAGETTWYDLACLATQVAKEAGAFIKASGGSIHPIPAVEYPLPAPRPMNSRMSTLKLQETLQTFGLMSKFPQWDVLVRDYVVGLVQNRLI